VILHVRQVVEDAALDAHGLLKRLPGLIVAAQFLLRRADLHPGLGQLHAARIAVRTGLPVIRPQFAGVLRLLECGRGVAEVAQVARQLPGITRHAGRPSSDRRVHPPEGCPVPVRDRAPASISWERFPVNPERLKAN